MLYQMVLADGIVDVEEIKVLSRIGSEKYGITSDLINQIIRETNTISAFPDSLEEKVSLLYQLGEVAWADGQIDETEKALMKKYIASMGFESDNSDGITEFILENVKKGVSEQEVINMILTD